MGETTDQYLARLKVDSWANRQAARNANSQAFKRAVAEANMANGKMKPLLEDLKRFNDLAHQELDEPVDESICERCGQRLPATP